MAKSHFKPVRCPAGCTYAMRFQQHEKDGFHCGYILYTGHSRGCDPGPGCIRYKKPKKRKGEADA